MAFFLSFIFTPLILALTEPDKVFSDTEKRPLAEFPKVHTGSGAVVSFTRDFDTYYQDHFGLREFFIHRYQREMKKRFNAAGSEVVMGKDGWLYYAGEGAFDDLMGRLRLSDEQLDLLFEKLEAKREWLGSQGIQYLALVTPNKQTIYPDYLPDYYRKGKQETRFDQVLQRVNTGSKNQIVDIRSALLAQKDKKRLYDKTDTHWNYLGAYYGYREIMKYVGELFPAYDFAGYFNVGTAWQEEPAGDLAVLSGQEDTLSETRPVIFAWIRAQEKELNSTLNGILSLEKLQPYYTVREERKLKALVLHDSFMNPMKVFLSESFAEVLYVWKYYDDETMSTMNKENIQKVIDEFQPDIVLDEIVERHLFWVNL